MFPGYVFIRSELGQEAFDRLLTELGERKQGMIRQLKEEGTTAMRKEERESSFLICWMIRVSQRCPTVI